MKTVNKTKRPYRHYTDIERASYYEDWRDSGMSMAEYCRIHRIGKSNFTKWKKQFEQRDVELDAEMSQHDKSSHSLSLVPLSIKQAAHGAKRQDTTSNIQVKLPLNDTSSVSATLSLTQLIELIKAFKPCS